MLKSKFLLLFWEELNYRLNVRKIAIKPVVVRVFYDFGGGKNLITGRHSRVKKKVVC